MKETLKTANLKNSVRRWVVERTNSWHNKFSKLFVIYEKKAEIYLSLVQLSSGIILYKKMILGYALSYATKHYKDKFASLDFICSIAS